MKKTRKRFLQTEFIRFLKERKDNESSIKYKIEDDFPLDHIDGETENELEEVEPDETDL